MESDIFCELNEIMYKTYLRCLLGIYTSTNLCPEVEKSEWADAILHWGNNDMLRSRHIGPAVHSEWRRTAGEASAVNPDENGEELGTLVLRYPQVQVEAVLTERCDWVPHLNSCGTHIEELYISGLENCTLLCYSMSMLWKNWRASDLCLLNRQVRNTYLDMCSNTMYPISGRSSCRLPASRCWATELRSALHPRKRPERASGSGVRRLGAARTARRGTCPQEQRSRFWVGLIAWSHWWRLSLCWPPVVRFVTMRQRALLSKWGGWNRGAKKMQTSQRMKYKLVLKSKFRILKEQGVAKCTLSYKL